MFVVDGMVVIRKMVEGRVEVESVGLFGGRRGIMYEVKRVIYENLVVVVGV